MNKIQQIVKNTAWLFLAQLVGYLLAFFYTIYSAQYLGAEGFGILSFALAFVAIFGVLADLGVSTLAVREVARKKSISRKYLSNLLVLKIILSLLTLLLIALAINLMGYPSATITAVYWAALFIVFTSLSQIFYSIFQAYERMEFQSVGIILNSVVLFGGVFYAIQMSFDAAGFVSIYALASGVVLLFNIIICTWKFFPPHLEIDIKFFQSVIKEAWPFAASGIFVTIYFWIDSVLISLIQGNEAVGYYNVAYRLLLVFLVIPTMVNIAVFPVMSQYYVSSRDSLKLAYEKYLRYMLILGVPLGVGVTLLAQDFILLFFGPAFSDSVIALQILVWASVLIFISSSVARLLESSNKQLIITKITALSAISNIVLNLALIPFYSYVGASIATVLTEFMGMTLGFMVITRMGYIPSHQELATVLKIFVAGGGMALFMIFFPLDNIWLLSLGGLLVYGGVLYALRAYDEVDIHILKKMMGKPTELD